MNDEPNGPGRSSFSVHPSALIAGVEHFNTHRFWHAHEAWEVPWLRAEGDSRTFLQGLIQLAAAYVHVQRGTYRGGVRLFDAALKKLEPFPPGYCGIDRQAAVRAALRHRHRIAEGERIDPGEFPKLSYNFGSRP
jgi:predicted metal-dependent hydrolase